MTFGALLVALAVVGLRSRSNPSLRLAAAALAAFAGLDLARMALAPTVAAWAQGEPITGGGLWGVRVDAWIVAGLWPAVVATLLARRALWPLLLAGYGVVAIVIARANPELWRGLLLTPRFAAGALAWALAGASSRDPSYRVGAVIAACQLGSIAFLWMSSTSTDWNSARAVSAVCWIGCALIVQRSTA